MRLIISILLSLFLGFSLIGQPNVGLPGYIFPGTDPWPYDELNGGFGCSCGDPRDGFCEFNDDIDDDFICSCGDPRAGHCQIEREEPDEETAVELPPYRDTDLVFLLTHESMRAFEELHAVSPAQERYLAFGPFVMTNNSESIRVFALGVSYFSADRILSDFWSVTDRDSALTQLEHLANASGQSPIADDIFHTLIQNGELEPLDPFYLFDTFYEPVGMEHVWQNAINRAENMIEDFEFYLELLDIPPEEEEDFFELFVLMQFTERVNRGLEAYQGAKTLLIETFGFTEEELLNLPSLAAWDYGRTAIIARYGVAAGFLEEEEAWAYLKMAADGAAAVYDSWREFTAAHILGRAIAFGNSSEDMADTLDFLLHHPESSFQTINFHE